MSVSKKLLNCLSFGGLLLPVLGCWPTDTPPDDWADVAVIAEIEPNIGFDGATAVTYDESGRVRLQGQIPAVTETVGFDLDYYTLGSMAAGDRIIVDVDTQDATLDTVAAIFDADGRLFIVNDNEDAAAGHLDPFIDDVFRHSSSAYYLIMSRVLRGENVNGTYEVHVTIERGGVIPTPHAQTVLLDFTGTTLTLPNVGTFKVAPFDTADIDSRYAGQTAFVKTQIINTIRQNYARFKVTILNADEDSPPADGIFSRVYFGGSDPGGLGMALNGTDFYNTNLSDEAVVFTGRFTPDLFTTPPDAAQLGTAIGNIAAHEIGHRLGLSHARDATELMNTYDAPDLLLTDQRFKYTFLDNNIFPSFDLNLGQDSDLLLAETVGLVGTVSNTDETVGSGPSSLCTADFDDDGDTDLAVACPLSSEVLIMSNAGNGTFPFHQTASGLGAIFASAADFAGSADIDLMVADLDADPSADSVYLCVNEGGGSFATPVGYAVPDGPRVASAADFDGDGCLDLAMAHALTDNVSILFSQCDDSFGEATSISELPFPLSIAGGDLDGDGDRDLAVGCLGSTDSLNSGGVWLLYNNGDATFEVGGNLIGEVLAQDLAIGDLNNDGWPDLAVTDLYSAHIIVMLNDGAGDFGSPSTYVVGESPMAVKLSDLDGDGALDLVVANYDTDDVSVLFNQGNGTFEPQWPYGVGDGPQALAVADFDGDGDLDLAVANDTAGTVSVLLNNGDRTFGRTPGLADSMAGL